MKNAGPFIVFLVIVAYVLDALGVDLEPQREDSKYYQDCKCKHNYDDLILPLRAPDLREEEIFARLMKLHGISTKLYRLCATNKDIPDPIVGFATRKNGLNYIVYERDYFAQSSYMEVVRLLGHEIGHHYLDHVSNYTNSWEEEIEADEFSGWSLFKVGYAREQSVNLISPNKEATKKHPSGTVQRDAIDRGWRQAARHAARKRR